MNEISYHLLDVFTSEPFGGNPLAVFPCADELSTAAMQSIANELNLSESVFINKPSTPEADCTLRIFTPQNEMPMAGHPTIGAAYSILSNRLLSPRLSDRLVFDEGVGRIDVDYTYQDSRPAELKMHQPPPEFGDIIDKLPVAELLSLSQDDIHPALPVQIVSTGVPFAIVPLVSLSAVGRAKVRLDLLDCFACKEVLVFSTETEKSDSDVHCRMFAPALGVLEDPATGGAQGPLASFLFRHGRFTRGRIVSEQGFELGRPSLLNVELETNGDEILDVLVGGECVEMGRGEIHLPSNAGQ